MWVGVGVCADGVSERESVCVNLRTKKRHTEKASETHIHTHTRAHIEGISCLSLFISDCRYKQKPNHIKKNDILVNWV